jgi:hypothetical protein
MREIVNIKDEATFRELVNARPFDTAVGRLDFHAIADRELEQHMLLVFRNVEPDRQIDMITRRLHGSGHVYLDAHGLVIGQATVSTVAEFFSRKPRASVASVPVKTVQMPVN